MRFKIGTTLYDMAAIEDLSLKMLLQLEAETARFGRKLTMADLRRMSIEVDAMPDNAARAEHPEAPWLTAASIWAARRLAGEGLDFESAIDFPLSQLVFLPGPEDGEPAPKARTRKPAAASGRAAAGRTRARKATGTSGAQS